MPPKKETSVAIPVKRNALKGKKMIITGEIDGQTRKSAEQILINAGATIEKSLNKKVELVALGENAGPKKLEKIEELGLETEEWDDLLERIKSEGGEEPAGDDEEDDEEEEEEEEEVEEKPKPQKAKAKPKANTKAKAEPAPKSKSSASTSGSFIAGKTVIVTGTIPGHDRKSAQAVVENAGAKVAKSLNKQVELLILGTNAGPDKLKKADEFGIETIDWTDFADKLGIETAPAKEVADVEAGDAPDSIEGMTIIISGTVQGQTRASAQKALEGAGATYAKSLNKNVELVVLGANPGPDKLNKIAELGIDTCSFEDLVEKLGLEVEQPPKKKAKKN